MEKRPTWQLRRLRQHLTPTCKRDTLSAASTYHDCLNDWGNYRNFRRPNYDEISANPVADAANWYKGIHRSKRHQFCRLIYECFQKLPGSVIVFYALNFDSFPLKAVVQRVVVVNSDVDIRNSNDLEWAIAMRASSKTRFGVLESPGRDGGSTVRLGIDATLRTEDLNSGRRPVIPDADRYQLEKYL